MIEIHLHNCSWFWLEFIFCQKSCCWYEVGKNSDHHFYCYYVIANHQFTIFLKYFCSQYPLPGFVRLTINLEPCEELP